MLITLIAASGRQRCLLGGAVLLVLLFLLILVDGDWGSLYGSRDEAIKAQKKQQYVLVGRLGRPDWPAIVVGRKAGEGGAAS